MLNNTFLGDAAREARAGETHSSPVLWKDIKGRDPHWSTMKKAVGQSPVVSHF